METQSTIQHTPMINLVQRNRFYKHLLVGIVLLAAVLFSVPFSAPVAAQSETEGEGASNGINLQVNAGLDGYYAQDEWLLVQVLASNSGPSVEGFLEIQGIANSGRYTTPISLPTQSNKKVEFYIDAPGLIDNFTLVLYDNQGREVARTISNLLATLNPGDSMLYGIVTTEPDTLDQLDRVSNGKSTVGVAYLNLEDLPADPLGWLSFDVVVLNDVDSNQLSIQQREAMDQWIQLGGQLVVTGGASWQKTTAALADLLPVTVSGSEAIDSLPEFQAQIGEDFRDPGPYLVATSSLKDGELLYHESGVPILARRQHGGGNVYFLAVDPQFAPLVDWDGTEILFAEIAKRASPPIIWQQPFPNESSIGQALSTNPSLTLPSVWLILGFLIVYILIIGPANYVLVNQSGRRELAWLTIPVTTILFSVAAFLIGLQFKGNQVILTQLSVVSGTAGGPALHNTALGIYSPNRATYDISLEGNTYTRPLRGQGFGLGIQSDLDVSYGNQTDLNDVVVDVGSTYSFGTSFVREKIVLDGSIKLNSDGSKGELMLTNIGQSPLININLLVGGASTIIVDDIQPGETISQEINIPSRSRSLFQASAVSGINQYIETLPSTGGTFVESPLTIHHNAFLGTDGLPYTGYTYDDPVAYQKEEILKSLFDAYSDTPVYVPNTQVTLVGWTESSPLEVNLGSGRFDLSAISLYFIDIPVE